MHRYHPQDGYLILNEFFLNEQPIPLARTKEDLLQTPQGREILAMYPDDYIPPGEEGFLAWLASLDAADWAAIGSIFGVVGLGILNMPRRVWRLLRKVWDVFSHDGVQGVNDLNAWISRTFGIDGVMPDMDDTASADSNLLVQIFAFIADDDFAGGPGLEPGDTFGAEDIEVMMGWFGWNFEQDGSMELEINEVHAAVEVIMDAIYAGGAASFVLWLANLLGVGSLLTAGAVTIGGTVVSGMLAFGIVMALYLLTYAIANGVQDLDGFFEEWGFEGWQEAYDGIEIIDFRGPDKPKPERGPLELKPYELDQDVKPYHDRFPS